MQNAIRKIGYARVSSAGQNLDRQLGALRAEGCRGDIFREKASGKDLRGRPQLEKAIDALGKGDVLVIAEWDRATRSAGWRRDHRAHSCARGIGKGARQASSRPDHTDWPGLHRFPVGTSGGRAAPHPQAGQRRPDGSQKPRCQVRSKAEALRAPAGSKDAPSIDSRAFMAAARGLYLPGQWS